VLDKAITTRLSFAQRESNNYQALEDELPNLWEVVQKSYQRKAWKIVVYCDKECGETYAASSRYIIKNQEISDLVWGRFREISPQPI
jgi:hypothetical protein